MTSKKIGQDWDRNAQEILKETKCQRCGFPCDTKEKKFCDDFNPDGGLGK